MRFLCHGHMQVFWHCATAMSIKRGKLWFSWGRLCLSIHNGWPQHADVGATRSKGQLCQWPFHQSTRQRLITPSPNTLLLLYFFISCLIGSPLPVDGDFGRLIIINSSIKNMLIRYIYYHDKWEKYILELPSIGFFFVFVFLGAVVAICKIN